MIDVSWRRVLEQIFEQQNITRNALYRRNQIRQHVVLLATLVSQCAIERRFERRLVGAEALDQRHGRLVRVDVLREHLQERKQVDEYVTKTLLPRPIVDASLQSCQQCIVKVINSM